MRFVTIMTVTTGVALVVAGILCGPSARAATDLVTSCSGSASAVGSLPYAVLNAASGDTINFSVTCPAGSPITLASTVDVGVDLTIDSPAASSIVVSGNNDNQAFLIDAGITATISGLTIEDGNTSGSGGGIDNEGSLALTNSAVSGNTAVDGGGGILNNGTLQVGDTSISDNTACPTECSSSSGPYTAYGGGILNNGTLQVNASTISGNTVCPGECTPNSDADTAFDGGGILNNGTLQVTASSVSGNTVCPTECNSDSIAYADDDGGAIDDQNSNTTVTGSSISDNSAPEGGGVWLESTDEVTSSTLSDNTATRGGGGADGGTISNSTFSDNTAVAGGGVYSDGKITDSTFTGNTASIQGGAVFESGRITGSTFDGNSAPYGGAVYGGSIIGSTFYDNSASYGGAVAVLSGSITGSTFYDNSASSSGGAIWDEDGTVSLTDSTLVSNTAGTGGGIYFYPLNGGQTFTITHGTLWDNTAGQGGGFYGNAEYYPAPVTLVATIVAGSGSGLDCATSYQYDPSVIDGGYNLADDNSCGLGSTSLSDTAPGLDPAGLQDNGGPTQTVALQASSPAVGYVTSSADCTGNDQRGAPWPAPCDIGAIQSGGPVPSITTLAATSNPSSYGQAVTFTATVSPGDGGGTVTFTADGNPILGCSGQSLSLVGGVSYQATCTTSSLPAGSNTVTATYTGDATYAQSAGTITEEVGPTTATVSSSLNPSTAGQPVTFTATVSPSDGGGTVSFTAGGNPISGCPAESLTLAAGSYQATCTTSSLSAGSIVVSAAYSGDTNYGGSSGSITQTVRTLTTTTVNSSPNPASYGATVTLTATVSATDGGGSVSFTADGNPVPGCSSQAQTLISDTYQATCTTSSLAAGSHNIVAAYSGDTGYTPSSGNGSVTIAKATPADVVTNSGPVTLGNPVAFTATVSGPAGAAPPSGSITWQVSGTAGATACTSSTTTLSSGTATCTIDSDEGGTYAVSGDYHGDGNYAPATSNTDTVTVTSLSTGTALTSSASPSTYGQPVTFTATASPSDGGGTLSFSADGKTISGCSAQSLSLVGGSHQATCTTSALTGGSHTILASYSGDTNYSGSSATLTQTVSPKPATTTVKSSVNPSAYGHAVTFTATVSPTDGHGSVTFTSGTGKSKTTLCPAQDLTLVKGAHQATCTTSKLAASTATTITASYSGDTDYGKSARTVSQTVNKTPTTTVLSSSKNPAAYGQRITLTAVVSPTDGAGTVTFWDAGNTITGCTSKPLKDSAGTYTATCTTTALLGGHDHLKAVYAGDKNCFGSTATLTQVIKPEPTATKLTSSPNPSTAGHTVTLTATTTPTDGDGTVSFTSNGHAISGCTKKTRTPVGKIWEATCKTSALPIGTDTVKAAYSGDASYDRSSRTVKQVVKSA
jgi:large repetitive protein